VNPRLSDPARRAGAERARLVLKRALVEVLLKVDGTPCARSICFEYVRRIARLAHVPAREACSGIGVCLAHERMHQQGADHDLGNKLKYTHVHFDVRTTCSENEHRCFWGVNILVILRI
jgi:hypothetical protein